VSVEHGQVELSGVAAINAWNRLNAATRQIAGAWAG